MADENTQAEIADAVDQIAMDVRVIRNSLIAWVLLTLLVFGIGVGAGLVTG